jgi:hypothetical protein
VLALRRMGPLLEKICRHRFGVATPSLGKWLKGAEFVRLEFLEDRLLCLAKS